MDPASLVLIPAINGAVEFLKRLQLGDYWAAVVIAVAAVLGALLGVFHAPGVADAWTGLVGGLAAAGAYTLLSQVGPVTKVEKVDK